ncbi:MAG: hypothetical protein WCP69_00595 [Bacteroidota bacterium]
MKKTLQVIVLMIFSFVLISWYPYIPKTTLKEKGLKGPVKTIIENVSVFDERNVIVQDFNKQGQLVEIRFFRSKRLPLDTALGNKRQFPIKGKFFGLDTTNLEYHYKIAYKYNSKGLLIQEIKLTNKHFVSFEEKHFYNSEDSLVKKIFINNTENKIDSSIHEYKYFYSKNRLQKVTIYNNSDTIQNNFFYFNEKNMIVKCVSTIQTQKSPDLYHLSVFEYGQNKLLYKESNWVSQSNDTMPDSDILNTTEYKYNNENLKTYERYVYFLGKVVLKDITRVYSYKKEHLKKIEEQNTSEKKVSITYFDNTGNCSKYIQYNLNSENKKLNYLVIKINYEYDKFKNWVYTDMNGIKDKAIRNITYYE